MKDVLSIKKLYLFRYIAEKLKGTINILEMYSVLNILIEEMAEFLKKGKTIDIGNFVKIYLKDSPPRHYHNLQFQKTMLSRKNKILKFKINPELKNMLCDHLDEDNTFNEEYTFRPKTQIIDKSIPPKLK